MGQGLANHGTLRRSIRADSVLVVTVESHYHTTMAKRHPNTTCDLCEKPIYRRPSTLARNRGKFCSHSCRNKIYRWTGPRGPNPKLQGSNNPAWKGGSYIEPEKGYRMIRMPSHPRARANGYVLEHILVAEQMLGRPLKPKEEVHHRNRNKIDNQPQNLHIYSSHRDHWVMEHLTAVHAARDAAFSRANTKGSAPA